MNKESYLNQLNDALKGVDEKVRKELMDDFNEHFQSGIQEGKSEAEIIASLGSVEELIEALDLDNTIEHIQNNDFPSEYKVDSVNIDGLHASIHVCSSKDELTHVRCEKAGRLLDKLSYDVTMKQDGSNLSIEVHNNKRTIFRRPFSVISKELDIYLEIPETLALFKCKTVNGDIDLDQVKMKQLTLSSTSGDMDLQDLETLDTTIDLVSGNCEINSIMGNLSVRSTSGDMEVQSHRGQTAKLYSVSGDIEYQGEAKDIGSNTTSGDGNLILKQVDHLTIETVSGDFEVTMGVSQFGLIGQFKTVSGELSVKSDNHTSTYEGSQNEIVIGDQKTKVYLKTISGDIEIH